MNFFFVTILFWVHEVVCQDAYKDELDELEYRPNELTINVYDKCYEDPEKIDCVERVKCLKFSDLSFVKSSSFYFNITDGEDLGDYRILYFNTSDCSNEHIYEHKINFGSCDDMEGIRIHGSGTTTYEEYFRSDYDRVRFYYHCSNDFFFEQDMPLLVYIVCLITFLCFYFVSLLVILFVCQYGNIGVLGQIIANYRHLRIVIRNIEKGEDDSKENEGKKKKKDDEEKEKEEEEELEEEEEENQDEQEKTIWGLVNNPQKPKSTNVNCSEDLKKLIQDESGLITELGLRFMLDSIKEEKEVRDPACCGIGCCLKSTKSLILIIVIEIKASISLALAIIMISAVEIDPEYPLYVSVRGVNSVIQLVFLSILFIHAVLVILYIFFYLGCCFQCHASSPFRALFILSTVKEDFFYRFVTTSILSWGLVFGYGVVMYSISSGYIRISFADDSVFSDLYKLMIVLLPGFALVSKIISVCSHDGIGSVSTVRKMYSLKKHHLLNFPDIPIPFFGTLFGDPESILGEIMLVISMMKDKEFTTLSEFTHLPLDDFSHLTLRERIFLRTFFFDSREKICQPDLVLHSPCCSPKECLCCGFLSNPWCKLFCCGFCYHFVNAQMMNKENIDEYKNVYPPHPVRFRLWEVFYTPVFVSLLYKLLDKRGEKKAKIGRRMLSKKEMEEPTELRDESCKNEYMYDEYDEYTTSEGSNDTEVNEVNEDEKMDIGENENEEAKAIDEVFNISL